MVNGIIRPGRLGAPTRRVAQPQVQVQQAVSSEQLERQRQQQTESARQQRASESIKLIEERIELERDKVRQARQDLDRANQIGDRSNIRREKGKLDRISFRTDAIIDKLNSVRNEASSGNFRPQDVLTFALTSAEQRIDRSQLQRQRVTESQIVAEVKRVIQSEQQRRQQSLGRTARADIERSVRASIAGRGAPQRSPRGFVGVSTPEGVGFVPIGGSKIFQPVATTPEGGILLQEKKSKATIDDLEARTTEESITGRIERRFQELPQRLQTLREEGTVKAAVQRGAIGVGAAVGGAVLFGQKVITEPQQVATDISLGVARFARDPGGTLTRVGTGVVKVAKEDPAFFTGVVFGELALFKGLSKVSKIGKEPVIFREAIKPIETVSKTKAFNVIRQEQGLDFASFTQVSARESRKAFVTTSSQVLKSQFFRADLPKGRKPTITELQLAFPKGKVVEISPTVGVITKSDLLVIKEGQILGALTPKGFQRQASIRTIKGTTRRVEPIIISRIEGGFGREKLILDTFDPKKLTKTQRQLIENIERDVGGQIPKGFEFELGSVEIKDVFKVTKRGDVKIIPKGRKIRRGDIVGITSEKLRVELEGTEFGLKGFEKLSERLAVADVTFPLLRRPKRTRLIRGEIERKFFELPARTEASEFIKKTTTGRTKQIRRQELSLKQVMGASTLKQTEILRTIKPKTTTKIIQQASIGKGKDLASLPLIVGGLGKQASAFAGTGLFEVSESAVISRTLPRVTPLSIAREIPLEITREISKLIPRQIPKEIARQIPRLTPKEIPKLIPKQVTRQTTRLIPRLLPRTVPRTTTSFPPLIRITLPKSARSSPRLFGRRRGKKKKEEPGFRVLIRRRGKERVVGTDLPKGAAISIGKDITQKTLARTFRLEATGKRALSKGLKQASIPSSVFRRPKGKTKLTKPLTFIERSKFALSTPSEISEITRARRRRR